MSNGPVTPQKSKSRLGRGLSSLLSVSELPVEADITLPADRPPLATAPPAAPPGGEPAEWQIVSAGALQIPVDQILPNPHQPRREMKDSTLAELSASIKSTGLIQPIIVRKTETGFQLIAGERRLRAAKLAGVKAIPAVVREVDAYTQAQMALVENIQREDLNPLDRAQAYRSLLTQLGLTQAELANRLGEDRSVIAHYVRLLELAQPVRELIRVDRLSLGHAKLLAGVEDPIDQQRLADLCVAQDLSVRNLERLLAEPRDSGTIPPSPRTPSAHLADLEKSIARQLGMRVQVRSGAKGKGRLVIHYASLDQFDDLMKRMGVQME